jgi:hypothetical protein
VDAAGGIFVGRAGELAVLEAAAAAARRGQPQVVLVEGEGSSACKSLLHFCGWEAKQGAKRRNYSLGFED